MGQPFALDFGAVMTMGAALEVDTSLLAEVLPRVERAVIAGLQDGDDCENEEAGDE